MKIFLACPVIMRQNNVQGGSNVLPHLNCMFNMDVNVGIHVQQSVESLGL